MAVLLFTGETPATLGLMARFVHTNFLHSVYLHFPFMKSPKTIGANSLLAMLGWAALAASHGVVEATESSEAKSTLTVTLNGIRHDKGELRVSIYRDSATFRKEDKAVAVQKLPAKPGQATFRFPDLTPGRYAVMAYHDEDGNGRLNLRFGMMPTEGRGLSRNPTVIGPPAFEDSAFDLGPGTQEQAIQLRY